MAVQGLPTVDAVIAAFDDHLRCARGIGSSARQSYSRFAREFLEGVAGDGPVDLARLRVCDVVRFVTEATARYRPSTVQLLTTALRSFFRFARSEGLGEGRLGVRLSRWCPAGRRPCRVTLAVATSPA